MRLYRSVIGLIAGLGLLVVGVLNLSDTAVKCGSEVMRPGDACSSARKGVTTERTYDQQRPTTAGSACSPSGAGWS